MFGANAEMASYMSMGIFELNFSSDGVTGRFGSGGVDISRLIYEMGNWGYSNWQAKNAAVPTTETAKDMYENSPDEETEEIFPPMRPGESFDEYFDRIMKEVLAGLVNGQIDPYMERTSIRDVLEDFANANLDQSYEINNRCDD